MKIAIIGRSELLYETAKLLIKKDYQIPLIITNKSAPEYKIKEKDFKNLAKKINAKFLQTAKINTSEITDKINSLGIIDIAISINYSGIISDNVIKLFKNGVLNAHGGDLPRYRGNACQAWAIINGEEKVGLCIHKMIGGELDSGDIISKVYYPININTRVGEIYQWMEKEIPKLMLKSINKLSNPSFKAEKQSTKSEDIFRTYPRNPDDGKIDWKQDANKILRLINASSEPFSGAFSLYNNEKIIIWRAKLLIDKENYSAIPGQISKINKNTGSIEVITGNGKIKIIEIEFKNQRGKPSKFINSIRKRFK
tara:strand:- start:16921 stop:17853 length:933 start_codon:yes stop_codon:yes gene_type:complete